MEYWIRRRGAGASAKKGRRARKWQHTKFNFKSAFIFHIVCWFLSLSHLLFPFGTLFVHYMYTFFFLSFFFTPHSCLQPLLHTWRIFFRIFRSHRTPAQEKSYISLNFRPPCFPSIQSNLIRVHTLAYRLLPPPIRPPSNLPPAKGFFVRCPPSSRSLFLPPFSFWRTTARGREQTTDEERPSLSKGECEGGGNLTREDEEF